MEELKQAYATIMEYLMLQSHPIAIKMLAAGELAPEKARRPLRDMGRRFSTCQGYNMVRRYGWTIAMAKEDMQCALGVLVLGFDKPLPVYTEGNLCEGMYTATAEAGARSEAAVDRHEPVAQLVDQPELAAQVEAERAEHARGQLVVVGGEEERLAVLAAERVEHVLRQELRDRRLPRAVGGDPHPGQTLAAELLLDEGLDPVDLASRQRLGLVDLQALHHPAPLDRGAEGAEGRTPERIGELDQLEEHA